MRCLGPSFQYRANLGGGWFECACKTEEEHALRRALGDALDKAETVRWAGTGMDRVHVETGTMWRWCGDVWQAEVTLPGGVLRPNVRPATGGWDWDANKWDGPLPAGVGWAGPRSTRHLGWRKTEADAMRAALDAAGWKP